jgi:hypothetical protein
LPAVVDEQRIDLRLGQGMPAGLLAGVDAFGPRRRKGEQFRIDEIIIDDDVRGRQTVAPLERQQARIARPGADEIDFAQRRVPPSSDGRETLVRVLHASTRAGKYRSPRPSSWPTACSAFRSGQEAAGAAQRRPDGAPGQGEAEGRYGASGGGMRLVDGLPSADLRVTVAVARHYLTFELV